MIASVPPLAAAPGDGPNLSELLLADAGGQDRDITEHERELLSAAAESAAQAAADMLRFARNGEFDDEGEHAERLADALRMLIDAREVGDSYAHPAYSGLVHFLDGWAPST